jgi:PAS domain-containing protein
VTWSDELFRIFQRDPREGAPRFADHPAFYHPDDMARLRQAAVADGTPYELELRAIRKDGEIRLCVARGVAEMAPGGRGAVSLFRSLQDITDQKRAEEKRSLSRPGSWRFECFPGRFDDPQELQECAPFK